MLRGGPRAWQQLPPPELLFWSLRVGWGELLPKRNHCPLWEIQQVEWRGAGASTQPPRAGEGRRGHLGWSPARHLLVSTWSMAPVPTSGALSLSHLPHHLGMGRTDPACDWEGLVPVTPLSNLSLWGRTPVPASRPSSRSPGARGPSPPSPLSPRRSPPRRSQGFRSCGSLPRTTSL